MYKTHIQTVRAQILTTSYEVFTVILENCTKPKLLKHDMNL